MIWKVMEGSVALESHSFVLLLKRVGGQNYGKNKLFYVGV